MKPQLRGCHHYDMLVRFGSWSVVLLSLVAIVD